jgi:hypothetical protein
MANEKRLVDANALDEKLETLKVRFKALGKDAVADDYNFVQTVLLTAPTVDAVEVVHGRWINRPSVKGQVYCSECATIEKSTDTNYKSRICPNCGADMR